MSAGRCRDPGTQLALLDRIGGTAPAAEAYGRRLEALRGAHSQLAALNALGSEAQRQQLQALVDQVCCRNADLNVFVLLHPFTSSRHVMSRTDLQCLCTCSVLLAS